MMKSCDDAYLFLLKHHEVEVLDSLVGVVLYSLSKGGLRDDLANVLIYERLSGYERQGTQSGHSSEGNFSKRAE